MRITEEGASLIDDTPSQHYQEYYFKHPAFFNLDTDYLTICFRVLTDPSDNSITRI